MGECVVEIWSVVERLVVGPRPSIDFVSYSRLKQGMVLTF
jgi:hypothetical protein